MALFPTSGTKPMGMIDEATQYESEDNPLNVDTVHLRKLCLEWIETKDFRDYFWEMHSGIVFRAIVAAMGVFNREYWGYGEKRGKSSPELIARYRKAVRSAPIVFANIVMANTALLHRGTSSPALVVVASGEGAESAMAYASSVLSRIHFEGGDNAEEEVLAATIEDEDYRFGRRRQLPEWLVGTREAYAADLWVPGAAVHQGGLQSNLLPCFAEPGVKGLTFAIPKIFVEASIRKTPPPLPQ